LSLGIPARDLLGILVSDTGADVIPLDGLVTFPVGIFVMVRGNRILRWSVLLVAILCAGLLAQWMRGEGSAAVPSVSVGGVVNNASYNLVSTSVAPGTIVAVFGSNLTDGTSCVPPSCNPEFEAGKLKTTMSGAQITVNGLAVPIFYATPVQLGIQIPTDLPGTSASIRVTVGGQTSAPRDISIDPFAPGIFTASQDGKGSGTITHSDGSLVNAGNPARPGEVVIIYATGLGQVTPAVPTGALPRGTTTTLTKPTVTIDNLPADVQFSGLAVCCVGLNQINAMVPVNVRMGNDVPMFLSIGGRQSNTVTIAVAENPLIATPDFISFGDVPVNTSSTRSVTITNVGTAGLTMTHTEMITSTPVFSASDLSLPLRLEPGQSTTFSLTFLPTGPGGAAARFAIYSDAIVGVVIPMFGNSTFQPTITTHSLPAGRQGNSYSATLTAEGGLSPYSWSTIAGTLPEGLTLVASTGVISGTVTGTGTRIFTVRVTDVNAKADTAALSITAVPATTPPALGIVTDSLPEGRQNTPYDLALVATGGQTPYTWSLSTGSLPAGLTLGASTGVISGTPTSPATSSFAVRVADANSQTGPKALSLTVVQVTPLSIVTNSLPAGTQSALYNAPLAATGGQAPYSWSIIEGTLPAGLTLAASTGVISGTPTSTGASAFTVGVTDSNGQTNTKSFSLVVVQATPAPVIVTNSLPEGIQSAPYSAPLMVTGGQTPYSWSISEGTLPAGLTLAASTGVISGTPTSVGTSAFTVRVTDGNSQGDATALSITVTQPTATPTIVTNSLPAGTQSTLYNATMAAAGGQTPYSWAISAGTLPAGLTLAASTGVISGTPASTGTSSFSVRVTDGNTQTNTKALSITINLPLAVTTTSLPAGTSNSPYNASVVATGGQTPYSWVISAGTLPAGLTLGVGSGVISGTPTTIGTSNFTVRVTDANSQTDTKALSITVNAPNVPVITTTSLPNGTQNAPYSAPPLAATGGQTPYSWVISAGALPAGLTLGASTGVISGTPTSTGTSNFTVQVTDTNFQTAIKALSITVSAPPPPPPPPPPPSTSVSLTWTASTSVVAGYNVYRGTVTGGPFTKLNSTLIPSTTLDYTDITILSGQTYIYAVTAVNSSGVESLFSNEATAVVP